MKPQETYSTIPARNKELGPGSAGQSGDTQGLSDLEDASSESVTELLEEGQFFEAEVISGIENAPEPDRKGIRTKQVPTGDVPDEYLDEERFDK